MSTRAEILDMIRTNERQREVAKGRNEWDVVRWHNDAIRELYNRLSNLKE
jgi:hypothetical protein